MTADEMASDEMKAQREKFTKQVSLKIAIEVFFFSKVILPHVHDLWLT